LLKRIEAKKLGACLMRVINGVADVQRSSAKKAAHFDEDSVAYEFDQVPQVGKAGLIETRVFFDLRHRSQKGRVVKDIDRSGIDRRVKRPGVPKEAKNGTKLFDEVSSQTRKDESRLRPAGIFPPVRHMGLEVPEHLRRRSLAALHLTSA
jgi:hypothetical protein